GTAKQVACQPVRNAGPAGELVHLRRRNGPASHGPDGRKARSAGQTTAMFRAPGTLQRDRPASQLGGPATSVTPGNRFRGRDGAATLAGIAAFAPHRLGAVAGSLVTRPKRCQPD